MLDPDSDFAAYVLAAYAAGGVALLCMVVGSLLKRRQARKLLARYQSDPHTQDTPAP